LPVSAIYKFPEESKVTSLGLDNCALVAGQPSPIGLGLPQPAPPPATVVMMPVTASTRRTRLLMLPSEKNKLPDESRAIPFALAKIALVAAPPSPLKPSTPVPASVLITPLADETLRTR